MGGDDGDKANVEGGGGGDKVVDSNVGGGSDGLVLCIEPVLTAVVTKKGGEDVVGVSSVTLSVQSDNIMVSYTCSHVIAISR